MRILVIHLFLLILSPPSSIPLVQWWDFFQSRSPCEGSPNLLGRFGKTPGKLQQQGVRNKYILAALHLFLTIALCVVLSDIPSAPNLQFESIPMLFSLILTTTALVLPTLGNPVPIALTYPTCGGNNPNCTKIDQGVSAFETAGKIIWSKFSSPNILHLRFQSIEIRESLNLFFSNIQQVTNFLRW